MEEDGAAVESCPLCRAQLKVYQVNLHDALKLCTNEQCTFPLGLKPMVGMIIKRAASDISNHKKKKTKAPQKCPSALKVKLVNKHNIPRSASVPTALSKLKSSSHVCKTENGMNRNVSTVSLSTLDSHTNESAVKNIDCSKDILDNKHALDPLEEDPLSKSLDDFIAGLSPQQKNEAKPSTSTIPCDAKINKTQKTTLNTKDAATTLKDKDTVSEESIPSPKSNTVTQSRPSSAPCLEHVSAFSPDFMNTLLQWKNVDNLCWLDVSMILLMHCQSLIKMLEKITEALVLGKLLVSYNKAQECLRRSMQLNYCLNLCKLGKNVCLETSVGQVIVRTGGGNPSTFNVRKKSVIPLMKLKGLQESSSDPFALKASPISPVLVKSSKVEGQEDRKEVSPEEIRQLAAEDASTARQNMRDIREVLWRFLQPRLRCQRGQNDSPVFVLPLVLGENAAVKEAFTVKYTWKMTCTGCGHLHTDKVQRIVPTFPHVPPDFSMERPYFVRTCLKCHHPGQSMVMHIDRIPEAFFVHFVEGLHHHNVCDYSFPHNGAFYAVKALIQFKTKPDHFVAWLRNPDSNQWMECDDLKPDVCKFASGAPRCQPSQVHMVMWERSERVPAPATALVAATVPLTSLKLVRPLLQVAAPTKPLLQVAAPTSLQPVVTATPTAVTVTSPSSHGPGALLPNVVRTSPAASPSVSKVHSNTTPASSRNDSSKTDTVNERLQRMKARFSQKQVQKLNTVPLLRMGSSLVTGRVQSPAADISSADANTSVDSNQQSVTSKPALSSTSTLPCPAPSSPKSVQKATSYLDALKPYLKKTPDNVPGGQQVFSGYVPKASAAAESSKDAKTSKCTKPSFKESPKKVCFNDRTVKEIDKKPTKGKKRKLVGSDSRTPPTSDKSAPNLKRVMKAPSGGPEAKKLDTSELGDTVVKLEINGPVYKKTITLKSPISSRRLNRSGAEGTRGAELDEIFEQLRKTLEDEPQDIVGGHYNRLNEPQPPMAHSGSVEKLTPSVAHSQPRYPAPAPTAGLYGNTGQTNPSGQQTHHWHQPQVPHYNDMLQDFYNDSGAAAMDTWSKYPGPAALDLSANSNTQPGPSSPGASTHAEATDSAIDPFPLLDLSQLADDSDILDMPSFESFLNL